MNAKLNVSRIARNYGTLFAYIIMLLVFSILAPSAFPTLSNVISILRQIAMLATISLGLTFVLITPSARICPSATAPASSGS